MKIFIGPTENDIIYIFLYAFFNPKLSLNPYIRNFLNILILFIIIIYFSNIFKLTGIWLAYPIAQVILTIIALYFIYFILLKAKNINVTVDTEYSI